MAPNYVENKLTFRIHWWRWYTDLLDFWGPVCMYRCCNCIVYYTCLFLFLLSGSLNIGKRNIYENWINKAFDYREIKYRLIDADSMVVCGGLVAQWCLNLATSQTAAHQASLSMGFPRQEYCSGLPFPSPDLPAPVTEPQFPALQADSLPTEPPDSIALAEFLQRMKHPCRNILPCFL